MNISEINIRLARKADMPAVLDLIKTLAAYENAPQEVTVTLADLEQDGFEANLFTCLVAEFQGEILGMALYYPRYSTWKGRTIHLEDFVVKPTYRQFGVGKLLFDAVLLEAKKFGAKRFEWMVLEWNEPAISFYKKYGAKLDAEWHIGTLTEAQIEGFTKPKQTQAD